MKQVDKLIYLLPLPIWILFLTTEVFSPYRKLTRLNKNPVGGYVFM